MTKTPGRPRLHPGQPGVESREEILAAAASLFAEKGFAGSTTRQIAERARVRQASLYYHFSGKEAILLELLQASVTPTLARAEEYLQAEDARAALYDLARADAAMLLAEPHNIGTMYLSPEIDAPAFAEFRAARGELTRIYGELARRIDPELDEGFAGTCCIQLVEMVIRVRQEGTEYDELADHIARACLRVCGVIGEWSISSR
jgi:AcrR family transcriptional regulator